MTVDIISRGPSNQLHLIKGEDDVIEREKELHLPLHRRLELVAGFNIHQLVKDARQKRHTLHTRNGFYLSHSPNDIAALFERAPTRSTGALSKSSRRFIKSAKSSKQSMISSKESAATSSIQSDVTLIESNDTLRFCPIHGRNVTLSLDCRTAARFPNTFCDGIVIGQRPMNVGERIHVRLSKVRRDWRGGFRLGFTTQEPSKLVPESLPSYAVPDLSRTSRFWAVRVPDRYIAKNNVLSFLLQEHGRVLYFINNQSRGIFLKGLNCRKSWFPVMDLYGRVVEISIVDEKTAELGNADLAADESKEEGGQHTATQRRTSQSCSFHTSCGRNIRMDSQRKIAKRVDSFWNSLTFLSDPIRPHDVMYIEIAKANTDYAGALGVGVTDVDPSTLKISELPDNADLLTKNTSQYWHILRDVVNSQGDQLAFEMDDSGRITRSRNGDSAVHIMDADISKKPLWFVLDVYGSTITIHLMGIIRACDPKKDEGFALAVDDVTELDDDSECMMCYKSDRVRNCAIQPCGHMTFCCWCAITCLVKQSLRFIVCPICGGPVCDVVKILSPSNRRASIATVGSGGLE